MRGNEMRTHDHGELNNGELKVLERYTADLIVGLRLRDVPGRTIGEIVAEVESHVATTGESPYETFGPVKQYIAERVPEAPTVGRALRRPRSWIGAIPAGVGGWLVGQGFLSGLNDRPYLGMSGWWSFALGSALLLGTFLLMPIDTLIDPRGGGTRWRNGRRGLLLAVGVGYLVLLAAMFGLHVAVS